MLEQQAKKPKLTDVRHSNNEPLLLQSEDTAHSTFYLDSVNRSSLNFDFDKVCLTTLSNVNVYCCLVCGKYFQGRSQSSPAYLHALDNDHHVFINLETEKFFILPDNYELKAPLALEYLKDIKDYLNPKYDENEISLLTGKCLDLEKKPYSVGFVGLNALSSDSANVILQLIAHITPIRDFYLLKSDNEVLKKSLPLNFELGLLLRRIWSRHLFRSYVSPNVFLQLSRSSANINNTSTPKKFLIWLLNILHVQLQKTLKLSRTILSKSLQGKIEIRSIKLNEKAINNKIEFFNNKTANTSITKFWVVTLDLPQTPVVSKDSAIQEIALEELLKKFNGSQTTVYNNELRTFQFVGTLPRYLLFHIDRGLESSVNTKGNSTVVKFPSELDMSPYVKDATEKLIYEPKAFIVYKNVRESSVESKESKSHWGINLENGLEWINISNLEVRPSEFELMFLEQTYIQLWERKA